MSLLLDHFLLLHSTAPKIGRHSCYRGIYLFSTFWPKLKSTFSFRLLGPIYAGIGKRAEGEGIAAASETCGKCALSGNYPSLPEHHTWAQMAPSQKVH